MAIRYYDEAVSNKINSWLPKDKNRKIQVLKPDETKRLFMIEADEKNDKPLSLPLIAISRDPEITYLQKTMVPMSFDGLMIESDSKHSLQINAIPISISYQLDIYTRRFDEGDELLREFSFKLINNPQIVIELPYNKQKLKHVATIIMSDQAEDTSDISERLFPGQFTRWTLRFQINGAYLFSIPFVDNVSIDYSLNIKNKDSSYENEPVMKSD
jgi:hypothetical protein